MREEFIFNLEPFLEIFSRLDLDVVFLTPTETAYKKSIMDAIIPVRDFLKRNKLHDYGEQEQGPDNKIKLPAFFVSEERLIETYASLYRPKTKQGDPRIWFYHLTRYCMPGDLLALITDRKSIYVLDLSNEDIYSSLLSKENVYKLLENLSKRGQSIAKELLSKIQEIHDKGFIPTVTPGDTGVGMTLENELGIRPNSSKNPDYKGIEIKASRTKYSNANRVNLFSQVPDWKNSSGMTPDKLLSQYGYERVNIKTGQKRFNLYCTVKANKPNPQGLYFKVRVEEGLLINRSLIRGNDNYVVQWSLESLMNNLLEKHMETFWVQAESHFIDGKEHFKYNAVTHTKKPIVNALPYLIDSGVITMDYTMHFKPNGKVRDHGYLFKINPSKINLLFPEPMYYDLNQ